MRYGGLYEQLRRRIESPSQTRMDSLRERLAIRQDGDWDESKIERAENGQFGSGGGGGEKKEKPDPKTSEGRKAARVGSKNANKLAEKAMDNETGGVLLDRAQVKHEEVADQHEAAGNQEVADLHREVAKQLRILASINPDVYSYSPDDASAGRHKRHIAKARKSARDGIKKIRELNVAQRQTDEPSRMDSLRERFGVRRDSGPWEDQERDEAGRFGSGGGGAAKPEAKPATPKVKAKKGEGLGPKARKRDLAKAQEAVKAGNHDEAAKLFKKHGISYEKSGSKPVEKFASVAPQTVAKATESPKGLGPKDRKRDLAKAQEAAKAGNHDEAATLFKKHGISYEKPVEKFASVAPQTVAKATGAPTAGSSVKEIPAANPSKASRDHDSFLGNGDSTHIRHKDGGYDVYAKTAEGKVFVGRAATKDKAHDMEDAHMSKVWKERTEKKNAAEAAKSPEVKKLEQSVKEAVSERIWAEQQLASQYSDNASDDGERLAMKAIEREAKMSDKELRQELERTYSKLKKEKSGKQGYVHESKIKHIEATLKLREGGKSGSGATITGVGSQSKASGTQSSKYVYGSGSTLKGGYNS